MLRAHVLNFGVQRSVLAREQRKGGPARPRRKLAKHPHDERVAAKVRAAFDARLKLKGAT